MEPHGEQPAVLVCCACAPKKDLMVRAPFLIRRDCPIHGPMWFVPMVPSGHDGSLRLAWGAAVEPVEWIDEGEETVSKPELGMLALVIPRANTASHPSMQPPRADM